MKRLIIICLLTLISTIGIAQQEYKESKFNNFYFFAEIGNSTEYDLAIYGGIAVQLDRNYFKIKAGGENDHLSKAERKLIDEYYGSEKVKINTRSIDSYSLIYGRSYGFLNICQLQVGAGLSYVEKTDKDEIFNSVKRDVEPEKYVKKGTIGLPAEARLSLHYKRYLAVSCTYNTNLNPIKSTKGFTFGLSVGLF